MAKLTGRKPVPASLIDPKKEKRSKETIEKRRVIENSLKTEAKLNCPKSLSEIAKKEWRRVIRLYKQMGSDILCDLDIQALTMYCEAVAVYKIAQAESIRLRNRLTEIQGLAVKDKKDEYLVRECIEINVKTMNNQTKIISSLAEQLCLTPVGRARMGMMKVTADAPDALSELGF